MGRGFSAVAHFENEDVDLCGDILLVVNDREASDLGSVMYVVSIAKPTAPAVIALLPLGLTGNGRGSGHIANFVKPDCSQAWVDGGNLVEVVDLTVPTAPKSLGKFESAAGVRPAIASPRIHSRRSSSGRPVRPGATRLRTTTSSSTTRSDAGRRC